MYLTINLFRFITNPGHYKHSLKNNLRSPSQHLLYIVISWNFPLYFFLLVQFSIYKKAVLKGVKVLIQRSTVFNFDDLHMIGKTSYYIFFIL